MRNIKWEIEHGFRHFGGGSISVPPPPDNSEMMAWMQMRDERNEELYQQRQADILAMEKERMDMERANTLALQQEEAELLRAAQEMEDAAQEEAASQVVAEEQDVDNIITGFYGSLDDRPE